MAKSIVLFMLVLAIGVMETRHVHHRSIVRDGDDYDSRGEILIAEIDGIPIDVIRQMKPTRFVPVNNELFFKTYPPCEDGLKRDLLGNCREVWD